LIWTPKGQYKGDKISDIQIGTNVDLLSPRFPTIEKFILEIVLLRIEKKKFPKKIGLKWSSRFFLSPQTCKLRRSKV